MVQCIIEAIVICKLLTCLPCSVPWRVAGGARPWCSLSSSLHPGVDGQGLLGAAGSSVSPTNERAG